MSKFENLKAGDEVVVPSTGWSNEEYIRKVDRITKTQIVIGDSKFRITNGYEVGASGYHNRIIRIPSEKDRVRIHRANLLRRLKTTDFGKFETDVLEKIQAIIRQYETKTP